MTFFVRARGNIMSVLQISGNNPFRLLKLPLKHRLFTLVTAHHSLQSAAPTAALWVFPRQPLSVPSRIAFVH